MGKDEAVKGHGHVLKSKKRSAKSGGKKARTFLRNRVTAESQLGGEHDCVSGPKEGNWKRGVGKKRPTRRKPRNLLNQVRKSFQRGPSGAVGGREEE